MPLASPDAAAGIATRAKLRASRAPSVRDASSQRRVDRLERRLRLAQVERRRDERQRDDDAGRLQHEPVAQRRRRGARCGPSAASRPMPATAGGSTSGSSISVTTSARPRKRARRQQVGGRRADDDDDRHRDRACVSRLSRSASSERRVAEAVDQVAGGTSTKIATTGRTRNASAAGECGDEQRGNQRARVTRSAAAAKPAASSALRARAVQQPVDERARLLGVLGALHHGDAVGDLGLQRCGQLDRLELAVGGARTSVT